MKTDNELWNEHFNGKKFSIEALQEIEINNRGKGPIKKKYDDYNTHEDGPYFDPKCNHVHIWKSKDLIKNFIGPQKSNIEHIRYTDIIDGLYCSICHELNNNKSFVFNKRHKRKVDELYEVYALLNNMAIKPKVKAREIPELDLGISLFKKLRVNDTRREYIISLWKRIYKKVVYTIKNKRILYPISKYKTVLLWPWQLTRYQEFRLNNPNYKDSCIFIKDKMFENYATII